MKLNRNIFVGLIVALFAFAGGCAKQGGNQAASSNVDDNEIRIGEYGSMTGDTATFGVSTHNGIMMALEKLNAGGGVLGKKIKVISEDNQGKTSEAVSSVLKLINQNKVHAIIGEVASSRSLAAAPKCQQAKIPMLSPASTNEKVTQVGDYIFRACFTDSFQGEIIAKFVSEELKSKNVAVLVDQKSDYSLGLAQNFTAKFTAMGGTVLTQESYMAGDIDFKAQLTKIKGRNPQVIVVPGYYTQVGQIARQARELGITVPLVGGDGWDSEETAKIGGQAIEGSYYTNHYSPDDPRPEVQSFVNEYKQKYGKVPDAMAVLGYDAMFIMADAIKRAGSTEGSKIRDALATTKDFPGVSGKITIDAQRNAQKPLVVLKFEGGKTVFAKLVNP
ncbi:MAG: ABC transporter substrate-binding protein [Verrucomicrobiota bacterium]|nr:ABC transporter substrate-binding protein [Verrucomicrobiota bacterium]